MRFFHPRIFAMLLGPAVTLVGHSLSVAGPSAPVVNQSPSAAEQSASGAVRGATVAAEESPDATDPSPRAVELKLAEIVWSQNRFENVREGYQSLAWAEIQPAATYQVINSQGHTFYRGAFPQAFISGLPDGEHAFTVQGFSADGELVGASSLRATIVVNHWPMSQALSLLVMGMVIFGILIGLIVVGSIRCNVIDDAGAKRSSAQSEPLA